MIPEGYISGLVRDPGAETKNRNLARLVRSRNLQGVPEAGGEGA